jgi:hypothetical protein
MEIILIMVLFAISGFLMKISDDAFDEKGDKLFATITGILCGFIIGLLVVNSIEAAYIFFAILLGTLFSKKIDGLHHIITLLTFILVAFIFGIPQMALYTLIICSLAAYIDEIGNDNPKLSKKSYFLEIFFKYRFAMKLTILGLVILGIYSSLTGFKIQGIEFLSVFALFYFILFEISYEFAGKYFERIYKRISR